MSCEPKLDSERVRMKGLCSRENRFLVREIELTIPFTGARGRPRDLQPLVTRGPPGAALEIQVALGGQF